MRGGSGTESRAKGVDRDPSQQTATQGGGSRPKWADRCEAANRDLGRQSPTMTLPRQRHNRRAVIGCGVFGAYGRNSDF